MLRGIPRRFKRTTYNLQAIYHDALCLGRKMCWGHADLLQWLHTVDRALDVRMTNLIPSWTVPPYCIGMQKNASGRAREMGKIGPLYGSIS